MAGSATGLRPVRIGVRKEAGEMVIEWADGETSRLPLGFLRQRCPCAVCSGRRDQEADEAGLHVMTGDELATTAEVRGVDTVGRYAIRIRWADGHDTGIYTYDNLRRLAGEAPGRTEE